MSSQQGYYRFPTVHDSTVVFVSEDDLWSVELSGGVARRLTANPGSVFYPVFSPDGSTLAFTSRDEGQPDVYVMDAEGGQPRRITFMGSTSFVAGWDPTSSAVIVASDWQQPFVGDLRLYRIPLDSLVPEPLDLGPGRIVSFGPPRKQGKSGMVLARMSRDPAQWKRYRGGRAGTIWIDRNGNGEYAELVTLGGNLACPMWVGNRIFFLSDHEGHGNIYSVTPTGRNIERHTHHEGFYARWPSSDGATIVYHVGADLWALDLASGEARMMEVETQSARPQRNRRFQSPGKHLESVDIHPAGHSVALVARGSTVTMPLWEGAPLSQSDGSASRERLATWLHDGERIAVVSDDQGEETILVKKVDGSGDVERISGDFGRARSLAASPAGTQRIALTNHRHELVVINAETGKAKVIHRSPHLWIHGVGWSPDGRYLAFGASTSRTTSAIYIADVRTSRVRQVTSGDFDDSDPSFDPGGKYLYFLSGRTFDPMPDSVFHDYGFPQTSKPYALVLDSTTVSPFAVELAEPRAPGAPPVDASSDGPSGDKKDKGPDPVKIVWDGLSDRLEAVPVPHGRYGRVAGAAGRVLFSSYPITGVTDGPNGGPRGKLEAWDFATNKAEPVAEGIGDFTVTADGKVLGIIGGGKLRVVPSALKGGGDKNGPEGPGRESGLVDLDRVRLEIDPAQEWAQMFSEAWRLQRDYFWREDMASVNWKAVHAQYLPLVDRVGSRSEFSDLMWEMQGELGTSHAYEMGGEYRPEPVWRQGFLGADLVSDRRGNWKVASIPEGDVWDAKTRSPLTVPGVGIAPGDRIVSVDGVKLDRNTSPYFALADRANRSVRLTVKRGNTKVRNVVVKASGSETALRYRNWVESNRATVREATDGKAGYIHIPDMGPWGFSEFNRSWLTEMHRDGLVIDVRYNRGGNVSQLLLSRLLRKRHGMRVSRWNEPTGFPYESPAGPMVALTNESSGSDGDIFSHTFKWHGLGKLVGTRTWGGVTGIWPQQALVDGTVTTQPEYGTWFEDVGFGVENYGTDPDVEVAIRPQDYADGIDPQMNAALEILIDEISAAGPQYPEVSSHASMKAPKLPS